MLRHSVGPPRLLETLQLLKVTIAIWAGPQTGRHEGARPLWPQGSLRTAYRTHALAHGCIGYYIAAKDKIKVRDPVELGPEAPSCRFTRKGVETATSSPL